MISKTLLAVSLAVLAEARFGQEQVPIQAISQVNGGQPGQAATIAGAAVSDLLAGANACAKLQRADQIVAELGNGADAIAAAIGMVAAEKNFNPFAQDIPTICSDPTLPTTAALRGITPLIDPAVGGADVANALSDKTKTAPLTADGLSVADLLSQNGFSNFTKQDAAGASGGAANAGGNADNSNANSNNNNSGNSAGNANAGSANAGSASNVTAASASSNSCNNANVAAASASNSTGSSANSGSSASNSGSSANSGAAAAGAAADTSSIAGLDFGQCVPTMKFEGGLGGRKATEFTFQATDALVAKGQQEALNPNIITNRICDQLTNVCEANDAAKSACQDAKAKISALGTRDQSTADAWNTALGFAGASTNPDGGPAAPAPSASAAAARKMRKVRRAARGSVHREVMDWNRVVRMAV